MDIKEKLDVVIITYNRKDYLKNTLDEILSSDSPIKDFDITVLDNASVDGTCELVEEYQKNYGNLRYVKNPKNIGGCANIIKAFVEIPKKEYIWVLGDNDKYNWADWGKIKEGINQGYDLIMTRKCDKSPSSIYYISSFVPAFIYKTSNIDENVIENMYAYVGLLFPHFALSAKIINENRSIFVVEEDIVHIGINFDHNTTFVRGLDKDSLANPRKNIFWSVGYFSSIELIKDRKTQTEIIENTRHFHKNLFGLFKSAMVRNKVFYNNYWLNFHRIFRVLSFKQKLLLILAYLNVNLSFKNYYFYNMRSNSDWVEYLTKIKEQEYIDKLAKKLKNKKILLYGAGLVFDVLKENFDLTKLNIIGISDKKFETIDKNISEYKGFKVIKRDEIKEQEFDTILFTMKLYKKIAKSLKEQGANKKMLSVVKNNFKYAVRS